MQASSWEIKQEAGKYRCKFCGVEHPNPSLCDIYRYCLNCKKVMRDPKELVADCKDDSDMALHILIAAYGDMFDSHIALNVTAKLRELVRQSNDQKSLLIDKYTDLIQLFDAHPLPGQCKVRFILPLRYDILTTLGATH